MLALFGRMQLEEVQRKSLTLCLGAIRTSGREALEVELNIQPLEIRRMELFIREAGRILSKAVDVPIKTFGKIGGEIYVAVWQHVAVYRIYQSGN